MKFKTPFYFDFKEDYRNYDEYNIFVVKTNLTAWLKYKYDIDIIKFVTENYVEGTTVYVVLIVELSGNIVNEAKIQDKISKFCTLRKAVVYFPADVLNIPKYWIQNILSYVCPESKSFKLSKYGILKNLNEEPMKSNIFKIYFNSLYDKITQKLVKAYEDGLVYSPPHKEIVRWNLIKIKNIPFWKPSWKDDRIVKLYDSIQDMIRSVQTEEMVKLSGSSNDFIIHKIVTDSRLEDDIKENLIFKDDIIFLKNPNYVDVKTLVEVVEDALFLSVGKVVIKVSLSPPKNTYLFEKSVAIYRKYYNGLHFYVKSVIESECF